MDDGVSKVVQCCITIFLNYYYYYFPTFGAIFMEKWKVEGFYMPTPNPLHVDQCARVAPNGAVVASNQTPTKSQPPSGKVAKADHLNMKVKE